MIRALFGAFVVVLAILLVITGKVDGLESMVCGVIGVLIFASGLFALEARGQWK